MSGLDAVRAFMEREFEPDEGPDEGPEDGAVSSSGAASGDAPGPVGSDGGDRMPSRGGGVWDPACPVVPLGVRGGTYYFLDELRQLRDLDVGKTGRAHILSLFGRKTNLVYELWPKNIDNDTGRVTSWRTEKAQEELMAAASMAGVWDPFERVRGAGAWRDEDGGLRLHCGDCLIHFPLDISDGAAPTQRMPGKIGRYIYPSAPPGPRPSEVVFDYDTAQDPGAMLREIIESWAWKRPEIDPLLIIGWIGAAMIGGALKWRPAAWVTGGKGTGKSTLIDLIKLLLDDGLVSVADATGAGIWQKLGYSTLPVVLDEQEGEEDNRKINNVIKLARLASSGGMVLRGGADHTSSEFVARSCFLFQSIITPPLLPQDRSRLAILDLDKLRGDPPPIMDPKGIRAMGAQLRRRIADAWPRMERVLHGYRVALEAEGHDSRGADQFGTLLALADIMLLSPRQSGIEAKAWALALQRDSAVELGDDADSEAQCLRKILTTVADAYRGGSQDTIANWIAKATGRIKVPDSYEDLTVQANKVLTTYGIKVVKEAGHSYLAVANSHEGLAKLYQGSQWATRSGASEAPWVRQLRRLPGVIVAPKTVWIGTACRATLVPLALVFPPDTDWKSLASSLGCVEVLEGENLAW